MILLYQGTKFAFVVEYEVVVSVFIDSCVVSWNAYVSDSDLAFMSSTDFDAVGGNVLDNHHVVGFLWDALEHDVLTDWFLDWHQLVFFVVLFNKARVLLFADFTVKLFEIVLNGTADYLFLHFWLIPLLETVEVN